MNFDFIECPYLELIPSFDMSPCSNINCQRLLITACDCGYEWNVVNERLEMLEERLVDGVTVERFAVFWTFYGKSRARDGFHFRTVKPVESEVVVSAFFDNFG